MAIKRKKTSKRVSQVEPRRSFWLLVPPPLIFLAAFLTGVQADHVLPLPLVPLAIHPFTRVLGIALVVMAGLWIASAPILFLRHRTTIVPHGKPRTLIIAGPYLFTRNPMYLGFTAAYVGVLLMVNCLWPLLFLILPLWVLQTKTIPFEEKNLARIFEKEYLAYKQHVRRWI